MPSAGDNPSEGNAVAPGPSAGFSDTVRDVRTRSSSLTDQPVLAIVLSLALAAGILLPAVIYALMLRPKSPADVLVSSSICLFSSIVYLWTLHAISIVPFRESWMGKAIFGAAITAILGASAASFKAQLSTNPYPLTGSWNLTIQRRPDQCVWVGKIILAYSTAKYSYVGYAEDNTNLSATCVYGIRGIKHVEWVNVSDSLEILVANYAVSDDHRPENQTPETLVFRMEETSGRWLSKMAAEKTSDAPFIVTMARSD